MKKWKNTAVMLGGLASCAVSGATSRGAIVITEIMSSSGHPAGANNGDWFELTNNGTAAQSLVGWSWDDTTPVAGSAHFNSGTSGVLLIAAKESVIISEETVGQEAAFRTSWGMSTNTQVFNAGSSDFQGLGSAGDEIHIFNNASTEVTSIVFGAASAGRTFNYDLSGNSLGFATAGVNGAKVADTNGSTGAIFGSGTDIGSPGVVPEPGSLSLLGVAGLAALRRRRKGE